MLKAAACVLSAVLTFSPCGHPRHIPVDSVRQLSILTPMGSGTCTAFSINEQKHYWLTADHCIVDGAIFVLSDEQMKVEVEFPDQDLAIVSGVPSAKALEIADDFPAVGTAVYKWGFGNGWSVAWLSEGHTSGFLFTNPEFRHIVMVLDLVIVPGDSGSPVLTYDNKVVTVAELAFSHGNFFCNDPRKPASCLKHASGGIDTITLHQTVAPWLQ